MEIKNTLNPLAPYERTRLAGTNAGGAQRAQQGSPATKGEPGDRVSLSPEARLRTEAFAAAMNASGTRAEKVAELKARVDSGEYVPDSKAIAAKLLAEESGIFRP